jgi:hypothetical protein
MKIVLRAMELRSFGRSTGRVSAATEGDPRMMAIRHGVYFDETVHPRGNTLFHLAEYNVAIGIWLKANIAGKYSVQTSYVFFEDETDATMCYLAFR